MKVSVVMLKILLILVVLGLQDCFAGKTKNAPQRPGMVKKQSRNIRSRKSQKPVVRQQAPKEDAGGMEIESEDGEDLVDQLSKVAGEAEAEMLEKLDLVVRRMFNQADRFFALGKTEDAKKLFEEIADTHKFPLAYERLGDLHLELAEEDPYNVVIAQRYYNLAQAHGWPFVIPKLLKVGEILGKIAEDTREKPMSEAVRMSMYT